MHAMTWMHGALLTCSTLPVLLRPCKHLHASSIAHQAPMLKPIMHVTMYIMAAGRVAHLEGEVGDWQAKV